MKAQTMMVYGDTHIPYQDDKVLKLLEVFARDFKPDIIVHGGDLLDCYQLSTFDKMEKSPKSFGEEIRLGHAHLKKMRKYCKEMDFIEGNHEWRLQRYLAKDADKFRGLVRAGTDEEVLTLPYLMNFEDLDVSYVPMIGRESYKRYNDLYVGHFDRVAKHSGFTAKALVEDKGVSVIQGHVHRMGKHYKTTLVGELVGIENGCTCNLHPSYIQTPNWQHGFSIVYLDENGRRFTAYDIPISDYKFHFGGEKYSV